MKAGSSEQKAPRQKDPAAVGTGQVPPEPAKQGQVFSSQADPAGHHACWQVPSTTAAALQARRSDPLCSVEAPGLYGRASVPPHPALVLGQLCPQSYSDARPSPMQTPVPVLARLVSVRSWVPASCWRGLISEHNRATLRLGRAANRHPGSGADAPQDSLERPWT